MLLVIPPGLPFELPSCQVLLMCARHVVESKEEGFCVQLLEEGRVVQHRQLNLGIGSGDPPRWQTHAHGIVGPVGIYWLRD